MPYIFVRSCPEFSGVEGCERVVKEAYKDTRTHIDYSNKWSAAQKDFLENMLAPLTETIGNRQMCTPRPPFEVLDKLQALHFSVVKVNTNGATTKWALQHAQDASRRILVRNTMNMEPIPISDNVTTRTNTNTYIDSSFELSTLETQLGKLARPEYGNRPSHLLFISSEPLPVIDNLCKLGFSVVPQDSVGEPTVWTLQIP